GVSFPRDGGANHISSSASTAICAESAEGPVHDGNRSLAPPGSAPQTRTGRSFLPGFEGRTSRWAVAIGSGRRPAQAHSRSLVVLRLPRTRLQGELGRDPAPCARSAGPGYAGSGKLDSPDGERRLQGGREHGLERCDQAVQEDGEAD